MWKFPSLVLGRFADHESRGRPKQKLGPFRQILHFHRFPPFPLPPPSPAIDTTFLTFDVVCLLESWMQADAKVGTNSTLSVGEIDRSANFSSRFIPLRRSIDRSARFLALDDTLRATHSRKYEPRNFDPLASRCPTSRAPRAAISAFL